MTATDRLRSALFDPVDAASVVAFRVTFGVLMFLAVLRFFAHGWIAEYFLTPRHFFPYYGFEWVRPWPGAGMYVHFAAMGVLALMVAAGALYRAAVALFGALFAYAHLIDKTHYLNHYYLLFCLCALMTFLPLHRAASIDAWRLPALRGSTVPGWVLWALRAQIGLVYFFGGVAKLKTDWLVECQPLGIWLAASTDLPIFGRYLDHPWTACAMSWAGAAFDLSIVPLLLWRRSRPLAYLAVFCFHLVTGWLFQLGMFPWIMMASSLLFLSPGWPRRMLAFVRSARMGTSARAEHVDPRPTPVPSRGNPVVLGLLGLYFSFHLAMPLRHLLHPGDVCWTEEGFRFSWNVMLMEKAGSVDAHVTESPLPDVQHPARRWQVAPADYFTRYQTKMMATQPDMILHFAHIVARDFRARGVQDPQVRVDAFASLNGRRHTRLVDPTVDLAREVDGLGPKHWILPLPEETDSDRTGRAGARGSTGAATGRRP